MDENKKITHKELLTFSNLTGLEWEFVDLEEIKYGAGVSAVRTTQLNDLLTPEVFTREDENNQFGDNVTYIYGERDQNGEHIEETGLVEMRQKSGIAMEYLEKTEAGNEEGEFLKDWEVIYTADNYKTVKDYLDDKWQSLSSQLDISLEGKDLYPTRERIEEIDENISRAEDWQARIEFGVDLASSALEIAGSSDGQAILNKTAQIQLSSEIRDIAESIVEDMGENIIEEEAEDNALLAIAVALVFNIGDPISILENSLEISEREFLEKTAQELEKVKKELNPSGGSGLGDIKLTERLDMRDTGFRAVALEKEIDGQDYIVITYRGNPPEDRQALPRELDLLQMIFYKLKRENEDAKIVLTGYQDNGDLSFMNALFTGEAVDGTTLFYKNIEELRQYINFTPDNIDDEYQSLREILISEGRRAPGNFITRLLISSVGAVIKSAVKGTLFSLKKATLVKSLLLLNIKAFVIAAGATLLNVLKDYFLNEYNLEQTYESFDEKLGIIEKEKNGITGYITDSFLENECIEVEIPIREKGVETIKIKKSHLLYLVAIREINIWQRPFDSLGERGNELEILEIRDYDDINSGGVLDMNTFGDKGEWILKKKDEMYVIERGLINSNQNEGLEVGNNGLLEGEELEKEIDAGRLLTNLMEIIGIMQRNCENKKEDIFEFIYPTEGEKTIEYPVADGQSDTTEEITSPKIEVVKGIPEETEKPAWIDDSLFNEFAFMPLIDQDSGNIESGYISDNLRDDYIASVIKSVIQRSNVTTRDNRLCSNSYSLDNDEIKFGGEDNASYYISVSSNHDMINEADINQTLFNTILVNNHHIDNYFYLFNYYEVIIAKVDKEDLSDYYNFKAEMDENDNDKFSLTGIKINYSAEDNLEYKYNPADKIIGGGLALVISGREINAEEALSEIDFIQLRELEENGDRRTRTFMIEDSNTELNQNQLPEIVARVDDSFQITDSKLPSSIRYHTQ